VDVIRAMSSLRQDKVRTSVSTPRSSACLGFQQAQVQIMSPTRAIGASLNVKQLLAYVHPKGRVLIAPQRITIARFLAWELLVKLAPVVALRVIGSAGTRMAATMLMPEIQTIVALGNSKRSTGV